MTSHLSVILEDVTEVQSNNSNCRKIKIPKLDFKIFTIHTQSVHCLTKISSSRRPPIGPFPILVRRFGDNCKVTESLENAAVHLLVAGGSHIIITSL